MRIYLLLTGLLAGLLSCDKEALDRAQSGNSEQWLADTTQMTGTSITSPFPLVENAQYHQVQAVSIRETTRVLLTRQGGQVFAYPLPYMGFEVLNAQQQEQFFAVSFCPLTKSALVWDRVTGEDTLTFAASGILYKENLVPYDLETRSLWSQMLYRKIRGSNAGKMLPVLHAFETNWSTVKQFFPDAQVFKGMTPETKAAHGTPPDGATNETQGRYASGEKVFGAMSGHTVFTHSYRQLKPEIQLKSKNNLLLVSSSTYDFTVSFFRKDYTLRAVQDSFPVIMKNSEGIYYDVWGRPVNKHTAPPLESPPQYYALWWAWKDFYENFIPFED